MTRKQFFRDSAILGIGLPFASLIFQACDDDTLNDALFDGKVLIIGAGAAGISAGFFLKKYNIEFEILEASSVFGGRLKRADSFVDFPIDLGAEWIHENPNVLGRLLDDSSVNNEIDTIVYNPGTISAWFQNNLSDFNWASSLYQENKFKSTTWFGFFEKYMIPSIEDKIRYDSPVTEINYEGNKVFVTNGDNNTFEADKVIVTVPTSILKNDAINFIPSWSAEKAAALESIYMPDGLKVFIEFAEKFYPDILFTGDILEEFEAADKLYYNAAFKKDSNKNVLGLFTVGEKATRYTNLVTDEAILEEVMNELDTIFDGKASEHYINHSVQNWSNEPFIQGSYTYFTGGANAVINSLSEPLDEKVYFAGEALSKDNGATVPGASETGYEVVKRILQI